MSVVWSSWHLCQCECESIKRVEKVLKVPTNYEPTLMRGSSHIQNVPIGVKYRNWCRTFCYLDGAYLIKTDLHICNLWTGQFISYKSIIKF